MVRIAYALFLCLMIGVGEPCVARYMGWGLRSFLSPLCLELYHIFVMNAPYGVCFRSLFYVGVEALFLRWRGVVLVVLFPFVFGGFPDDLRCFFDAPWV